MPEPPGFKDWRATRDSVMVADVGFKKQLWALDPELDVVWDWGSEKWEIWKFPEQGGKKKKAMDPKAFHVLTVQTQGRSFRELGADILLRLQAGDPQRYSLKELVAYFDQMDENIQRAKRRDLVNRIESITRENMDWMRGVLKVQVPQSFKVNRAIIGRDEG
jgi:hypothetical protein